MDTRTEVLVQKAMSALRADRTRFVIAHRLSTIRDADLILVMEAGADRGAGHARVAAGRRRGLRASCTRRSSRLRWRRFRNGRGLLRPRPLESTATGWQLRLLI